MVYLKISHMKGVTIFDKKGNLCSQYVGPYEILQLAGKVAYKFKLPSEQESVHPLFHVFMNKKCIGKPISILPIEGLVWMRSFRMKRFRWKSISPSQEVEEQTGGGRLRPT